MAPCQRGKGAKYLAFREIAPLARGLGGAVAAFGTRWPVNFLVFDPLDAPTSRLGRNSPLDHNHVPELVAGRVGLIEPPDGFHRDVPFAGFLGQGRAPPTKIRDAGIDLFPLGVGQSDGRVNMDVPPIRVHHEHIFVTRKLLREGGAGAVHERLLVGSGFRAHDHMCEIASSLRAHPTLPGFGEFQVRIEPFRCGVGGDAGSLKKQPARRLVNGESGGSLRSDLSAFCQIGEFRCRPFDAMRPTGVAPACLDIQGGVDPAVKAGQRFLVGVNPLQLAAFAALGVGSHFGVRMNTPAHSLKLRFVVIITLVRS